MEQHAPPQQQQHAQPQEIFSPAASAAVQGGHQLEPSSTSSSGLLEAPQTPPLLPLLVRRDAVHGLQLSQQVLSCQWAPLSTGWQLQRQQWCASRRPAAFERQPLQPVLASVSDMLTGSGGSLKLLH